MKRRVWRVTFAGGHWDFPYPISALGMVSIIRGQFGNRVYVGLRSFVKVGPS